MYCSPEHTFVDIVEDYQTGLPYVLFFSGHVLWAFSFKFVEVFRFLTICYLLKLLCILMVLKMQQKILVHF